MLILPLPFCDPVAAFAPLARRVGSLLLDTGRCDAPGRRYAILLAAPRRVLVVRGGLGWLDGQPLEDPVGFLRSQFQMQNHGNPFLPFNTGWAGYWGYEAGNLLEVLPEPHPARDGFPDVWLGDYPAAVVYDYAGKTGWMVAATEADAEHLRGLMAQPAPSPGRNAAVEMTPDIPASAYHAMVEKVKNYILNGDIYQANITQCFTSPTPQNYDAWRLFADLKERNPAPYMAYLNLPEGQVVSCSPEQFLQAGNGQITTRPIKGTRPRHPDPVQDAALAAELAAHPKDRAENLMIVDLLRNDLSRVCMPGSVRVPELWKVEGFPTVHHLVSTITGTLQPGKTAMDAFLAAFPGGSITGAPKIRAMEIIRELEPVRRGVYCGSIGYWSRCGRMDTNIAIRTITVTKEHIRFHTGCGIVADSDPEAEYRESLDKARGLRETLAQP